jgi:hypothetical protein
VSTSPAPGAGRGLRRYDHRELEDGETPIDTATVGLKLDAATVPATVEKTAKITKISYKPATPFAPKSKHTVTLNYTEAGTVVVREWFFVTLNTDLLGYWDFNDASNPKNAADKAGGGRDVTFVSTAVYSADARIHRPRVTVPAITHGC